MGKENTSIDMTLGIVDISEMQECGVCNVHSVPKFNETVSLSGAANG